MSNQITWVLESDVFPDRQQRLRAAVAATDHQVVEWDDGWWSSGHWPTLSDQPVVFHGSLGNAERIRSELPWAPGAYCDTPAFHCSAWYPLVSGSLLNGEHLFSTVRSFTADPEPHFERLGNPDALFVRPDSPLKPFSGRLIHRGGVSPAKLDHGFYYDDLDLPIVLAPPQWIGPEWRYVIVEGTVVAGSGYVAEGRSARAGGDDRPAQDLAARLAAGLDIADPVYVMDICEAGGRLALLELNPFSGADLYDCDREAIVKSVTDLVMRDIR